MVMNPLSKGPQGYTPGSTGQLEKGTLAGIGSRAGATKDAKGNYDFSNSFKPITGAAGIAKSTAGYNFNPINQAIQGYQDPRSLSRVNFKNLPKQFGDVAYENMARDLRAQNAGDLTKLNEQIGTRRPGLLLKAGQESQRNLQQQLAQGRQNIEQDIMSRNIDLDREEQLTNADLQKSEQMLDLDRLAKLAGLGTGLIDTQSGLVKGERGYEDQALEMLLNAWQSAGGFANQAQNIQSQNRKANLDFLGTLIGGASKAASAGMGAG